MAKSEKKKPTNRLRMATAVQTRAFEKTLAKIQRQQENEEKRRRDEPRLNFIAGALAAGFTRPQADFLWGEIPDTSWMNMYRPIAGARSSDV